MYSFLSLFDENSKLQQNAKCYSLDNKDNTNCLPPEPQQGNVEYKLKIVNPTKERRERLVTQLKWRLREGNGEAMYEIGVEDNGTLTGISDEDMQISLKTLNDMAKDLDATTSTLREREVKDGRKIAEVLVQKIPADQPNIEVRIAVLGNADAGKSTLLGVMTQGHLDNGNGRARLNMFRHLHEIQSGRTSSISHEILGFNDQGQTINYSYSELITSEEICEYSTKLVSFLDLAGHRKYMKTTIKGLSGYSPHRAMFVIPSNACVVGMPNELLSLAVALKIPFFVVITKIDMESPANTVVALEALLKQVGSSRVPLIVRNLDDVMTAEANHPIGNIVPIFTVSSVNGAGLDILKKFLHVMSPGISLKEREILDQKMAVFQIDEHFKAGDIEQIVAGLLVQGVLTPGKTMLIGPHKDGFFQSVTIKSLHRNRIPCRIVHAGQCASIRLDATVTNLRNGMVLLENTDTYLDQDDGGEPKNGHIKKACLYFQATVLILYHATAIYKGFQATVYIANIRQTATIMGIYAYNCLRTNTQTSVVFKFQCHPEYVTVGQRLLFREGTTKGIGEVTQVFPYPSNS